MKTIAQVCENVRFANIGMTLQILQSDYNVQRYGNMINRQKIFADKKMSRLWLLVPVQNLSLKYKDRL
ncbi:hypothetical protein D7V82_12380 [bacterium 1xD8-6]|jgi:hypothetical protein|nr:hypothetical protein D7V72_14460 [bacterium D16-36]RKI68039.1 hypothetical protein D7V82_12380 [bacterium 1xD8-6]